MKLATWKEHSFCPRGSQFSRLGRSPPRKPIAGGTLKEIGIRKYCTRERR
jgi:hypothetical protein